MERGAPQQRGDVLWRRGMATRHDYGREGGASADEDNGATRGAATAPAARVGGNGSASTVGGAPATRAATVRGRA
jgi:hypothetical protein